MEIYDYRAAMYEDIKDYIDSKIELSDYKTREQLEDYLNDNLWIEDSVTGNGSGSYTFNTYRAEEYICHNLDLLGEAIQAFGGKIDVLKDGAEVCDVTIRCYLLNQLISAVLDDVWDNYKEGLAD